MDKLRGFLVELETVLLGFGFGSYFFFFFVSGIFLCSRCFLLDAIYVIDA